MQYQNLLEQHHLTDVGVAQPVAATASRTVALVLGVVPFVIGYIFNCPPAFLTKFILDKYVKVIEFVGPIKMAVGTFSYLLYYVFWALFFVFKGAWYGLLLLLLLLGLGYFAILYQEYAQKWRAAFRFRRLSPSLQLGLQTKRREILSYLPC